MTTDAWPWCQGHNRAWWRLWQMGEPGEQLKGAPVGVALADHVYMQAPCCQIALFLRETLKI